MARKVYKRAGIIHLCMNGAHYAPKGSTCWSAGDRVLVAPIAPDQVDVRSLTDPLGVPETWVITVIGNDGPRKAPKTPKVKKGGNPKVDNRKPQGTSQEQAGTVIKEPGKDGLPTMAEVNDMLVETAPNDIALDVMRACWNNWVDSDRRLNLMGGLRWVSKDDTSQVKALGEKLMKVFR